MTEPERQDWTKIIAEIEGAGITRYKLAVMINEQYYTVSRWRNIPNVKVDHYKGNLLLAIHAEHVPRGTAQN